MIQFSCLQNLKINNTCVLATNTAKMLSINFITQNLPKMEHNPVTAIHTFSRFTAVYWFLALVSATTFFLNQEYITNTTTCKYCYKDNIDGFNIFFPKVHLKNKM